MTLNEILVECGMTSFYKPYFLCLYFCSKFVLVGQITSYERTSCYYTFDNVSDKYFTVVSNPKQLLSVTLLNSFFFFGNTLNWQMMLFKNYGKEWRFTFVGCGKNSFRKYYQSGYFETNFRCRSTIQQKTFCHVKRIIYNS